MTRRALFIGMLMLLGATVSQAQERLDLFVPVGGTTQWVEVDVSVSRFGEVRSINAVGAGHDPVALSGGRYIVRISDAAPALDVIDRRTRRSSRVALPPAPSFLPVMLTTDPLRPRLFVLEARGAFVIDAETLQLRQVWSRPIPPAPTAMAYAADSDEFFIATGESGRDIIAVNVATAVSRHVTTVVQAEQLVVDRSGRRLYVVGTRSAGVPRGVSLVDGLGGALAAESSPLTVAAPIVLDEPRGIVLVRTALHALNVLSATDLGPVAVIGLDPGAGGEYSGLPGLRPLPGRWTTGAYIVRTMNAGPRDPKCQRLEIDALSPVGGPQSRVDLRPVLGPALGQQACTSEAVIVRSPFAPDTLHAEVAGGTVTLSWRNPGDVVDFEVQAGLAPGRVDLSQRVGRNDTVIFSGVSPGTYYVRVRAFNEVGGSPVSDEIIVTVP